MIEIKPNPRTGLPGGIDKQLQYNKDGVFAGADGLFWDDANNRLGIGTDSPGEKLSVVSGAGESCFVSVAGGDELTNDAKIGVLDNGAANFAGIWLDQPTPSASNYAFLKSGTATIFNSPAGDDLVFRINNATKMVVDSSNGNVGIGETTPLAKLHIDTGVTTTVGQIIKKVASQSADSFQVQDSAGNKDFVIDADGNVGIGADSPDAPLHVSYSSPADIFIVERPGIGKYSFNILGNRFNFRDLTNNQYLFYTDYDNIGGLGNLPILNVGPYEPSNTSTGSTGLLKARGAGTTGTDTHGGDLYIASGVGRGDGDLSKIVFYTPDKVGTGTSEQVYSAKMTIIGTGNVGIGDTTPASKLTAAGDVETTGSANGLILESPDGSRFRVTVDNSGVLSQASI